MHIKSAASLAVALLVATGGYAAFAAQNESAVEAAALDQVTVTLAEAVATVEAQNTGTIVEAALLSESGASVFHITTLQPDGTETNYAVDARTGAVVTTVDVAGEEDDDNEHNGEGRNEGPNGDGDGESQDDASN